MNSLIETSSPLEIASLWRLDLLSGDDIQSVCLRWLQEDVDGGDHEIALLAGEDGLLLSDANPTFERVLSRIVGRAVERDEAILRALRVHLTVALEGDLLGGVEQLIRQFAYGGFSERRLVRHPRRAEDRPNGSYAAQELGLEYIHGCFYGFDDLDAFFGQERNRVEADLYRELRGAVLELKAHLTGVLGEMGS